MALVLAGNVPEAVVVNPVAEDLEVVGLLFREDALVLRVADLVAESSMWCASSWKYTFVEDLPLARSRTKPRIR